MQMCFNMFEAFHVDASVLKLIFVLLCKQGMLIEYHTFTTSLCLILGPVLLRAPIIHLKSHLRLTWYV